MSGEWNSMCLATLLRLPLRCLCELETFGWLWLLACLSPLSEYLCEVQKQIIDPIASLCTDLIENSTDFGRFLLFGFGCDDPVLL
jgi:hypothetical protein